MLKKRKISTIALSFCIVVAIAVGGTLAWLTTTTEKKTNKFQVVGSSGIAAEILEDAFTPAVELEAMKVAPGAIIPKDPLIKNTSDEDVTEWAKMRLTFTKGDSTTLTSGEMDLLNDVIEIVLNTTAADQWVRKNTGALKSVEDFYCNVKLSPGVSSQKLFTQVKIKTTASNANLDTIKNTWNGFNILVDGAVVQGDISATFDGLSPIGAVASALDVLLP